MINPQKGQFYQSPSMLYEVLDYDRINKLISYKIVFGDDMFFSTGDTGKFSLRNCCEDVLVSTEEVNKLKAQSL